MTILLIWIIFVCDSYGQNMDEDPDKDKNFWLSWITRKFPYLDFDVLNRRDQSWPEYLYNDLCKINPSNANQTLRDGSRDGRLDRVMIAMNNGADIHTWNDHPVIWASAGGYVDVVKYLMKNGANIQADNNNALRWACTSGNLDTVIHLVNNGADIHAAGPNGFNDHAIRLAIYEGHLDVVKYLVNNGANILIRYDHVVEWAKLNGWTDIVNYLAIFGPLRSL